MREKGKVTDRMRFFLFNINYIIHEELRKYQFCGVYFIKQNKHLYIDISTAERAYDI